MVASENTTPNPKVSSARFCSQTTTSQSGRRSFIKMAK